MTKFDCGCRIMSECINLNGADYRKPNWGYLLKTFVNVCGKCGKKKMKFQQMENMEKQRMEMFKMKRKTSMIKNIKNHSNK